MSGDSVIVTAKTNGQQAGQWAVQHGAKALDVMVPLSGKDTLGLYGGQWVSFIDERRPGTGSVPTHTAG